jgi:hypothetical protein
MTAALDVTLHESCRLNINFAYIHTMFCLVQAGVLFSAGKTENFKICHAFGLFAFAIDYALNYMTLGTRKITYPSLRQSLDSGTIGDDPLGPLGDLLFFIWFSYSAFGVLLWALKVQSIAKAYLSNQNVKPNIKHGSLIDMFALIIPILEFWSAPFLSTIIHIDDRVLLLERSSNKYAYVVLFIFGILLLRYVKKMETKDLIAITFSGFCCGLLHHFPLFVFGMRGYTDVGSLCLTLVSEWPAIIVGVAVIHELGWQYLQVVLPFLVETEKSRKEKSDRGTNVFIWTMWVAIFSLLHKHILGITPEQIAEYMMVYTPGVKMQSFGTFFMRLNTCTLPAVLNKFYAPNPRTCWADGESNMLVLSSAAKSGALLSGFFSLEIAATCGLCVASGERSRAGIPGPVEELPVYDGRFLLAVTNMRGWPSYVKSQGFDVRSLRQEQFKNSDVGRVRCVALVRDPLARVRSLYTYARSGGEHWFRTESGFMQMLGDPNLTLQQSLDLFWAMFGREYLLQSHEYTIENLNYGCANIKMEMLKENFNTTINNMLDAFGINQPSKLVLLDRLAKSDTSRMSEESIRKNTHMSHNKFSKKFMHELASTLMNMTEVKNLVEKQRLELGYT